ncbi:hypothetical protein [Edaphobacter aggregans]|uniref:hypothetical protein n=1 Tax=Edaphobacter aggregans TaxID=570835 RepID=UPI00054D6EE2|nr:hypothetical protein [Edaphobacter aggregans]
MELERVVAVDWSGRVDVAGQRRHIWAGVWAAGEVMLEAGRTREELVEWLIAMSRETPRMVVSLDCCFSFPAWFLAEHACETVFEFWRKVAEGQGERWLARECEEVARDVRFWGAPHKRPEELCGENFHRGLRLTDMDNKVTPKMVGEDPERAAKVRGITPKSPFQIGGSGSVGTGSLRAMPFLLRMWEAGFRVWPYESAQLKDARPRPLLVEMYTRLMTGAVAKSNESARRRYLAAKKRKSDALYAGLGRGVLMKAQGSEDAFDALVSCLEMVRWKGEFAGLKATEDEVLRLEGITWRPGIQES